MTPPAQFPAQQPPAGKPSVQKPPAQNPSVDVPPADGPAAATGAPSSAPSRGGADARVRRERALAVAGCLAGAAIVLFSSAGTWVSARVQAGAGGEIVAAPLPVEWSGGSLAPAASGLALVGLAAAVGVVATRGLGRTVIGLLLAAAGIGILIVAGGIALDPMAAVRGSEEVEALAPLGNAVILDLTRSAGPWFATAGGALLVLTGGLLVARGRSWPAMSGRYQGRAAAPADAWDAIERGHDPT